MTTSQENTPRTIIIGHRNPDTDSIASAAALAEFKSRSGMTNVFPAAAGLPGERTEYIFKRFGLPLPELVRDVHPRVADIMNSSPASIREGSSLLKAIGFLQKNREHCLPVVDGSNRFLGMLSLFQLLGELLHISGGESENSLTGRCVRSSVTLIRKSLDGAALSLHDTERIQEFEVFVAAMNVESFIEHIPRDNPDSLAIVVGDRADIHLMAINLGARLMIVTGSRRIDDVVVAAARERGVSIIKTPFDSATVIRRMKFSSPVEGAGLQDSSIYKPSDRLCDIRKQVIKDPETLFPVVDDNRQLLGTFKKSDLDLDSPIRLILVDHNEFEHAVDGIEEVPVIEIVDHHRVAMPPTRTPIRITCDTVGSTCTLVAEMFLNSNIPLTQSYAGILMGGVITDTMMLKSPTTTQRDRDILARLAEITGVDPETFTGEIFRAGSAIAGHDPEAILNADRKNFSCANFRFSIAQVEEASFIQFEQKRQQLQECADTIRAKEKLDLLGLLVTDIVRENSLLLVSADPNSRNSLPYRKLDDSLFDLPGILSRKKQLIPQLLKTFDPQA